MDKYLANYMFSNEVLFNIDAKNNSSQTSELVETAGIEIAAEVVKVVVETVTISPSLISEPKVKATQVIEKEPETPGLLYAKHKLLVIINNLTAEDKQFLEKILGSVKQSITAVSILDISSESIDLSKVLASANSKIEKVLSFGVAMSNIQLNILLLPYQVSSSQNVTFLMVDDMASITTNLKDEKRLLWAGLKTMFGLG